MHRASWLGSIAVCSLLLLAAGCREAGAGGEPTGTDTSTAGSTSGATDSGSGTSPECGNGVVDAGEECDDGNAEPLDGCEEDCTSSSGLVIWTATHDGPASGDDWIRAIVAAPDGTLILAGDQGVADESANVWLRKIDTDGNEVWTVSQDLGASVGPDTPDNLSDVAVDEDGNIAVTGHVRIDEDTNDWDIWTGVYDADGVELWTDRHADPDGGADYGGGVAFDGDGNLIIVGRTATATQGGDGWMRKLDPQGQELWTQTHNGPADENDTFADVATDGSTIVTVGSESAESGYFEVFIVAHDADGTVLWRINEVNALENHMYGYDVAIDDDGSIHAIGRTTKPYNYYDVWLAKYDSDGQQIWADTWDGAHSEFDSGSGITVGEAGGVFIAGVTAVPNQSDDVLAGSWDRDGNERWVHGYDGEASLADSGSAVALDADGFVYVVGGETVVGQGKNGWIRKYYP
jgi:cysteine-rich repeat protein